MWYITKRDSVTGQNLEAILKRAGAANDAALALAKEYGAYSARGGYWCVGGGISCFLFKVPPDVKLWRKVEDGFMPKANTKKGKFIAAKIADLPKVGYRELNMVISYNNVFNNIGYDPRNSEYFAVSVKEEWNLNMPADCEETTISKYKEMFK